MNLKILIIIISIILVLFLLYFLFSRRHIHYLFENREAKASGKLVIQKILNPFYKFFGAPNKMPPRLKHTLSKIGNFKIVRINVCRSPLPKVYKILPALISLKEFEKRYKFLGYDDIYHLYMILTLQNKKDGKVIYYRLEKNHIVTLEKINQVEMQAIINFETNDNTICTPVPLPIDFNLTVKELIEDGERYFKVNRPEESFWRYDPVLNNCQHFLMNMLNSQNLLNDQLEHFIDQLACCLVGQSPFVRLLQRLFRTFTDVGASFAHIIQSMKIVDT